MDSLTGLFTSPSEAVITEVAGDRLCTTRPVIIHPDMVVITHLMEEDIRVMIMDSAREMKDLAAETDLITAVRETDLIINYPITESIAQATRSVPVIMFTQGIGRE